MRTNIFASKSSAMILLTAVLFKFKLQIEPDEGSKFKRFYFNLELFFI